MLEETQEVVLAVAREACKKHHDGELKYYKTMAIFVKEQLDAKLGNSWHICVGKFRNDCCRTFQILNFSRLLCLGTNFGSFCTYETKTIYLFWLEHIGFLVWKHG